MDYIIRNIREAEYKILSDFLYEAIFIPEGVKAPPKDIINKPELQVYISDFGKHSGDYCLVAESDKKIVGAVWVRIMNDYGHVDNETPSFAISRIIVANHQSVYRERILLAAFPLAPIFCNIIIPRIQKPWNRNCFDEIND